MEHYHTLINEVTSIQWDKSKLDRQGDYYSYDSEVWAIRASRYNQRNQQDNYGNQLDELRERVFNELSLLPEEQIRRCIKRLTMLNDDYVDRYFPEYFRYCNLWYKGEFKALDFELKFFPSFKMQAIDVGFPDSPDFNNLITTDDFFYDLHDALMYKHGVILHLLYDLCKFVGDPVQLMYQQKMKEKEVNEKWFAKSLAYLAVNGNSGNLPDPKNVTEQWEQLTQFHAQREFERLRHDLYEKFGSPISERVLLEELSQINTFIQETKQVSVMEAFSRADKGITRYPHMYHPEDHKEEYIRLTEGYYTADRNGTALFSSSEQPRSISLALNGLPKQVYGRYVLYKTWLEKKVAQYQKESILHAEPWPQIEQPNSPPPKTKPARVKPTLTYEDIFVSQRAKDRFEEALVRIGAIDQAGNPILGQRDISKVRGAINAAFQSNTNIFKFKLLSKISPALCRRLNLPSKTRFKEGVTVYWDAYEASKKIFNIP